ncbi:MAG: hypothetical protein ABIQ59_13125 [Nocardioidaceae bacterium]
MTVVVSLVRRSFAWCRNAVDSIRHGEGDVRAVCGDNPNNLTPDQIALQGSVTLDLSHMTAGGLGM